MHRQIVAAEADSGSACADGGCALKEAVEAGSGCAACADGGYALKEAVEADSGCAACADGGCALKEAEQAIEERDNSRRNQCNG